MTHAGPARPIGRRILQRPALLPTPLSPATALLPSTLPPLFAGAVLLLRLPLRPPPRRVPTCLATVVPPPAAGKKPTPASLQQASPPTRATQGSLHSRSTTVMLKGAHGRLRLPKLMPRMKALAFIRGDSFLAAKSPTPPPASSTLIPTPHHVTSSRITAQFQDHRLPANCIGHPTKPAEIRRPATRGNRPR
jgi:hypothetical protein